jgi:hypothetical protein
MRAVNHEGHELARMNAKKRLAKIRGKNIPIYPTLLPKNNPNKPNYPKHDLG